MCAGAALLTGVLAMPRRMAHSDPPPAAFRLRRRGPVLTRAQSLADSRSVRRARGAGACYTGREGRRWAGSPVGTVERYSCVGVRAEPWREPLPRRHTRREARGRRAAVPRRSRTHTDGEAVAPSDGSPSHGHSVVVTRAQRGAPCRPHPGDTVRVPFPSPTCRRPTAGPSGRRRSRARSGSRSPSWPVRPPTGVRAPP